MSGARRLLSISLLAAVLAGCASARLTLNLDLYVEDPLASLVQLTPARVAELDHALKALARQVGPLLDDRRSLAGEMFNTYEAVNRALYRIENPDQPALQSDPNIEAAREYRGKHEKYLAHLAEEAGRKIKNAQGGLERAAQMFGQSGSGSADAPRVVTELSTLRAINEAADAVARLGSPVNTEFERLLISYWPTVARSITAINVENLWHGAADTPELAALRAQAKRLADRARLLREHGWRIPEAALTALDQAFEEAKAKPGKLKDSFDRLVLAASEVSALQAAPDQLENLVKATARVFNLVDRLQDPADPVWRLVSRPENDAKWRNAFTDTYFYAEGNTSVVVVRDTPFSFRVLKATNNPTTLVQGQLQVTRALANAALSVAGAATGAPIGKLPGAAGGTPAPDGTAGTEAEQLAKRKAKVERQNAVRLETLRNLRRNLVALRSQLERTDGKDHGAVDAVLAQVQALLRAYDILLAPAKP